MKVSDLVYGLRIIYVKSLLVSKKKIFYMNNLCPSRVVSRLNDFFSQEPSNLLVYEEGLIILACLNIVILLLLVYIWEGGLQKAMVYQVWLPEEHKLVLYKVQY